MYNMELSIGGMKFRVELLIAIALVLTIIFGQTCISCSKGDLPGLPGSKLGYAPVEGFTGASSNNGHSAPYSLGKETPVDTKSWGNPSLQVVAGQPVSKGVQDILNREPQTIPLPEGQMSMFANTPFKPECCPSTYSSSQGCACTSSDQVNYLNQRGGNRTGQSNF